MKRKIKCNDIKFPIEALRDSAELRMECFNELLEHIEAGFSINCFESLSEAMIFEFLKNYDEFCTMRLEISLRKAQSGWEKIGHEQATGKCIGNSRSWFYNMAHRYGWSDKVQVDANVKGNVNVSVINYSDVKPS